MSRREMDGSIEADAAGKTMTDRYAARVSHGQLTVEVDSEGADIGLKWNAVITELNVNNVDFQELLSTAQPNKLSFVRIQFETVSCHP